MTWNCWFPNEELQFKFIEGTRSLGDNSSWTVRAIPYWRCSTSWVLALRGWRLGGPLFEIRAAFLSRAEYNPSTCVWNLIYHCDWNMHVTVFVIKAQVNIWDIKEKMRIYQWLILQLLRLSEDYKRFTFIFKRTLTNNKQINNGCCIVLSVVTVACFCCLGDCKELKNAVRSYYTNLNFKLYACKKFNLALIISMFHNTYLEVYFHIFIRSWFNKLTESIHKSVGHV
jgi:hypothetical protein